MGPKEKSCQGSQQRTSNGSDQAIKPAICWYCNEGFLLLSFRAVSRTLDGRFRLLSWKNRELLATTIRIFRYGWLTACWGNSGISNRQKANNSAANGVF